MWTPIGQIRQGARAFQRREGGRRENTKTGTVGLNLGVVVVEFRKKYT